MHPGDLRVFKEMSGSDLDGDLYWATWHSSLIILLNRPPANFVKANNKQMEGEPTQEDLIEYMCESIEHSSDIGRLANAHLVHADVEQDGIYSEKCLKLADRHCIAVDFPKTGQTSFLPNDLKPTKYPDFMVKRKQTHYRRNSHLLQSIRLHNDIIKRNSLMSQCSNCQIEQELSSADTPEWYKLKTEKHYDSYAEQMRQILETYGFKDESHMLASSVYRLSLHRFYKSDIHEMALLMKAEIKELTTHFNGILLANDDPQVNINTKMLVQNRI